jgi:hypothetical protein
VKPQRKVRLEPYVWRTVNKREWPATGSHRHLVRKGGVDSLCGTTALPASVWRPVRGEKPDCPECVSRAAEKGVALP